MTSLNLSVGETGEIIERVTNAVMETRLKIPGYMNDHPEFRIIDEAMMTIWEEGVSPLKAVTEFC